MFLHSGASLHGHEYSDRAAPVTQHTYKRSPLLRSAFATPKPRPVSLDGPRPPVTSEPRRPFSDFVPRLPEPVVRFLEPLDKVLPITPVSEDAASVMSASELSDDSQSSEVATVTGSETSKRRRSRASSRGPRKTTTLALAYPAPRFAGKKRVVQKVAPKLFLQLQEVSLNKRPKPVIDVFPSSRIAGPVIAPRLAKRFPRLFGPKGELGSADVVLMRSEDYDAVSEDVDSEDDEGRMEQRQPVAVLSPIRKSHQSEIVLDDGSVWVAQPLPTGSFDFVRTDEHGNTTTARWARRPVSKTAAASASTEPAPRPGRTTPPEPASSKYTFSIINPETRRHPVMATLTPQFLDIQETYTTVSTSSGRYPPCRPLSRSVTMTLARQLPSDSTPTKPVLSRSVSEAAAAVTPQSDDARRVQTPEPDTERTTHPVDEATKLLITVTAVFLALESGWSPYFRPHAHPAGEHHPAAAAADSCISSSTMTDAAQSRCRPSRNHRSSSDEYSRPENPRKGSSTFSSLSASLRPHSRDQSPVRSFVTPSSAQQPAPWWETTAPSPASTATPTRPGPRRATSTGAAFMQRTRIASAQVAESSDSEHQPTKGRQPSRSRISSSGSQRDRQKDKDHRPTSRHSLPLPSSLTLPTEVLSPQSIDQVIMAMGQDETVNVETPTRAPSRREKGRTERKAQSAYYPATPPMVAIQSSDESGVELVTVPATKVVMQPNPQYQTPNIVAVDDGRKGLERSFSGRMKSLGHWFRRRGHDKHRY